MKTKAISLIVVFLVSLVSFSGQAISQEKVIVTLDWVISGYHAPFFIAKEKGYFKKEGLSVEVKRGFGSGRTTKAVGTGASTLGYADSGVMLKGIAGGLNLNFVSVYVAKSLLSYLVGKDDFPNRPDLSRLHFPCTLKLGLKFGYNIKCTFGVLSHVLIGSKECP